MLQPGTVPYLEVQFRQGPRNKYLIVLEWDDPVQCLIVNSEIHPLFGHGEFRNYYVEIDVAENTFLQHDSYIDCNEALQLSLPELAVELQTNPNIVVGQISNEVRAKIITAIEGTPGLSPDEKERFLRCLTEP